MYTQAKMKLAIMKPIFHYVGKNKIAETKLHVGSGAITKSAKILSEQNIDKVLVITDQVLYDLGLLTPMLEALEKAQINVSIYHRVKPDPTFTIVDEALAVCKQNECKAVIGFGGGSVLDTSKTVAACAANKYIKPQKLEGMMKVRTKPLPFIAIPTTAGTGSEVTLVAVISDSQSHQKTTIIDPKIVADDAILDPAITVGLPKHITSSTALDALTHAIEAYISGFATKQTDIMALKAIKLINENIIKAYNQPDDLKARENLLLGSMYAGQAFTRTYVGYVHAFSHNIGGKYGVAHGLANAVLLPHVMEDSKDAARVRFAELSDFLELCDTNAAIPAKADAFVQYLFDLNAQLNIPSRLEAFAQDGIDEIINLAFKEAHGTYPVPKYYTKASARELLLKVCNDN